MRLAVLVDVWTVLCVSNTSTAQCVQSCVLLRGLVRAVLGIRTALLPVLEPGELSSNIYLNYNYYYNVWLGLYALLANLCLWDRSCAHGYLAAQVTVIRVAYFGAQHYSPSVLLKDSEGFEFFLQRGFLGFGLLVHPPPPQLTLLTHLTLLALLAKSAGI